MSPERPIAVLVVDAQPIFREGLRTLISRRGEMQFVAEAATAREAAEKAASYTPDVALVPMQLPDGDGIETMNAMRRRSPLTRFVMLTSGATEDHLRRATQAGALAFLSREAPCEDLLESIASVHQRRFWLAPALSSALASRIAARGLTSREREVLGLLAAGKSNREIGRRLGLAEGTIKAHVNKTFRKLGVASRAQALAEALKRGLVDLERL